MYNGVSRQILCRYNTIKQLYSTRVICIDYVKRKNNIVDLLIKGLNRELAEKSSKGIRLNPIE